MARGLTPAAMEKGDTKVVIRGAGFFSCCLSLIKTIMGPGMLCLPLAFHSLSILPAVALMCFAGFLSGMGLYLLTAASQRVSQGRDCSFTVLAKSTYPRLAPVFDLAILLKCLGVTVAYLKVFGGSSCRLLRALFENTEDLPVWLLDTRFWITMASLLIAPVASMRKMDSLKYTSFLGMLSIIYLLGLSIKLCWQQGSLDNITWLSPDLTLTVFFKNFSSFVFAFTCHQNMLPIQNEARNNKPRGMIQVISMCVSLAFSIYVGFTICSLAVFGHSTIPDSIMALYQERTGWFILAHLLFAFLVLTSLPLQIFPARACCTKIIEYFKPDLAITRERQIYAGSTAAILAFCWALACQKVDLKIVVDVVGSTAGPVICYILPSVFWLKLERAKPWDALQVSSLILFIFGILTILITSSSIIFL